MGAERSSRIMLLAMVGIILLILLGSFWLFHRIDATPKAPLHSAVRMDYGSETTWERECS